MSLTGGIEYTSIRELRGPLAIVEGVSGIGWDEYVRITLASGELRHGVVLDADRDLAVVQVLEGTAGMGPEGVRAAFSGSPVRVPVGKVMRRDDPDRFSFLVIGD
ncbi:hypothetical protein ABZ281_16385, partial [Streptomyces sp. NPDC006265]